MAGTLRKQSVAGVITTLVLMGGPLGVASGQPAAPDAGLQSWPLDSHVRSSDDRFLNVLRYGAVRSPTLRDLIGALNRSDVIVYIESRGRMRAGLSAYLVHQIVTAGNHRYLKVVVNRELARDRLTGVLAHELQHAREVADAADVRSGAAMRALFERLDSGMCVLIRNCTETDAAVRLQATVLDELNAARARYLALGACSSVINHAFENFQSRMTVSGEMPNASDTSSTLRPPKNRSSTT